MTPEQQTAFIISQAMAAMIEAMAMQAENQIRAHRQEAPAYDEEAFRALPASYCIEYNQVLGFFQGR